MVRKRSLTTLERALRRFLTQAARLGHEERTRAMSLLLKTADDLLQLRFSPVPGKAAISMYLDELAEEAAALRETSAEFAPAD
jgi:hypothetical protein